MLARFSGLKAVYFDLDDTLCGYWDASKAALRSAFGDHGPAGESPERMVQAWASAFRGFSKTVKNDPDWYKTYCKTGEPSRTEQMRRALAEVGVEDEAMAARLSEAYAATRDANLQLFPDAVEVLQRLHARYPLGLITNGPADIQRQEIATLGIGGFFDHVFIEGELGFGKPEASVFQMAAEAVGAQPNELLFVGNSYAHDIKPAIEAGWKTVWVRRPSDVPPSRDGTLSQPEERPEGSPEPGAVIGELSELLGMIQI